MDRMPYYDARKAHNGKSSISIYIYIYTYVFYIIYIYGSLSWVLWVSSLQDRLAS